MGIDFDTIAEYFQNETETLCKIDKSGQSIGTWFKAPNGALHVGLRVIGEDNSTVLFFAENIVNIPENHRNAATYLVNLINYDLIMGNFELNPVNGNISYRNGFCVCDTEPTQKQLSHSIRSIVQLSNKYLPSFQRLIWGGESPVDAFMATLGEETDADGEDNPPIPKDYASEVIGQFQEMIDAGSESQNSNSEPDKDVEGENTN